MNILSVHNLAKIGREKPLFENVTFGLNEGEKAALIGRNGCGKSTMLSIIAGTLAQDDGEVVINKSLSQGKTGIEKNASFLKQNPEYCPTDTIIDHIFKSNSPKLIAVRKYETVCEQMSKYQQTEIPKQLQEEFEKLSVEMDKRDLWNYENSIRSILSTLGITDMTRQLSTLSGGMIKKVSLAQVLVEDTPLLLLDEPTNHLDISTISWLQDFLKNTDRAVLMVTHDRYFLDSVCSNIYELDNQKLKLYQGNYSTYLEKKEIENEIAQNTDRRIESVLRVERDWLMRGPCARGTKSKARIDNIHKMINREKFSEQKGFSFETAQNRLGGKILELHNITKQFPKGNANSNEGNLFPVLKNFSYTFNKGQKIGVFGDNGSGKSTLLNIITGKLKADEGSIELGKNTHIAYYEQNPHFDNTDCLVLDYIKETAEIITLNDGKTYSASQLLEQFDFSGKIQYSPVSTLSGGERKRLYLVRLLMSNPNFLILDEPTNDFDIFTMSILESFLASFSGCLLVVSHDRYFMDKVSDTLFILESDGQVSGFVGKCSEYIDFIKEQKSIEANQEKANKPVAEKQNNANSVNSTNSTKAKKRTYKEQKEFEQIEQDIFDLEDKKSELESLLSGNITDHSQMGQISKDYNEASTKLEQLYARWEELGALSEF